MASIAALPSFAGRQGNGEFRAVSCPSAEIPEYITRMTGSYHELVVRRKSLLGKKVLEMVVPKQGADRGISTHSGPTQTANIYCRLKAGVDPTETLTLTSN